MLPPATITKPSGSSALAGHHWAVRELEDMVCTDAVFLLSLRARHNTVVTHEVPVNSSLDGLLAACENHLSRLLANTNEYGNVKVRLSRCPNKIFVWQVAVSIE